jgi:hypothetical protein
MRLSPDGTQTLVAPNLKETAERRGGIKGVAAGPDGALYVSYPRAIQKITPAGAVTTVADPVVAPDCDRDVPEGIPEPYLRGLAVGARGTVYAAATGCRCVVKVTPDGKVATALKAERPWSPTGVAVHGDDVYVLEYTNPNGNASEWRPRVRKLSPDGRVTTLATITRPHPRDRK